MERATGSRLQRGCRGLSQKMAAMTREGYGDAGDTREYREFTGASWKMEQIPRERR